MRKEKADLTYVAIEGPASAALALCVGFFVWSLMFYYGFAKYLLNEHNEELVGKIITIAMWGFAHLSFICLTTMGARERNPHKTLSITENKVLFLSSFIPIVCCAWLFKELEMLPLFVLMVALTGIGSYKGIQMGNEAVLSPSE